MAIGYDVDKTVRFGRIIQVAYRIFDRNPNNYNPPLPTDFPERFKPIANILGKDKPLSTKREFYGHISHLKNTPDTLLISIRGTSDLQEWIDDAKFLLVGFPPDPEIGRVELGFNEIFSSFAVSIPGNDAVTPLAEYLNRQQLKKLMVTGHSLGSSLATLVAIDAAEKQFADKVELLTFASPRTGNRRFVNSFQGRINQSIRLVNKPDVVPKVPPWLFGYRHIWHKTSIDSHDYGDIRRSIVCYHSLLTYLHILDPNIDLEAQCKK